MKNKLDQFYTNPIVSDILVKELINLYPSIINMNFIEPSAGSGNFINSLIKHGINKRKIKAFDLEPKGNYSNGILIKKADYLLQEIRTKNLLIIGNPPFGKRGKLALEFLNKSLSESNIVAMILPNIFNRYSIQSKIDNKACLVYSRQLEENSFIHEDKVYGVKCVFQVWVKNSESDIKDLRIRQRPSIKHEDFTTYIHNNTIETLKYFDKKKYNWDFAVVRQGFYDYKEKIKDPQKLIRNRQYFFIKYNNKNAEKIINKVSFEKLSRTNTQILGFSTSDFVNEYKIIKGEI